MTADRRRLAVLLLTACAVVAAVLAISTALTGGFRIRVLGVPVSVRDAQRPTLLAIAFGALAWALLQKRKSQNRIGVALAKRVWIIPLAAAALALSAGLAFGTRSAGGSDTYGYVSQAKLWLQGNVHARDSRPADAPWPNPEETFTPLAYRPAANHAIVPIYSPGLPLLMALSELIVGACGPFLIVPVCTALLVWMTYALGARVSGEVVGVAASLCIATSPTVVMMTMAPMSDVPAAAFWTLSLVLACGHERYSPAAAGAAAAVAIVIRPNLAPLTGIPLLLAARPLAGMSMRGASVRVLLFLLACAPAVLFLAWHFDTLYGSPFESGYGRTAELYDVERVPLNLARYPRWLWDTQGPVPFLFLLTPWLIWRRTGDAKSVRWLLFGFVLATCAAYIAYQPFEEWWYLRFLLPAFPAMFVLAFDGARLIGEWVRGSSGPRVAVAMAAVAVYQGIAFAYEGQIIRSAGVEQRYADAGRFVAHRLPENGVLLSMQHSGSARLYSNRLTIRYDRLDSAWLDRALDFLRARGREPYLLLEDWEVPLFKERFAGQHAAAAVDAEPLAMLRNGSVLLFSTDPRRNPQKPREIIPRTAGCAVSHR